MSLRHGLPLPSLRMRYHKVPSALSGRKMYGINIVP